jgi:ParB-like chromosome segregation protein Spo0J
MQETICDNFVINDDYLNSIPRPSIDEFNALKMKIIEKGQQEPIIVNSDMVILDGHTRYQILSERGMSINYMVRDFANKQDEFEYVVETNIMRRQLNNFQKLEALYRLYVGKKTEKNYNLWIMILESIKQGNITRKRIASDIGYTDEAV